MIVICKAGSEPATSEMPIESLLEFDHADIPVLGEGHSALPEQGCFLHSAVSLDVLVGGCLQV